MKRFEVTLVRDTARRVHRTALDKSSSMSSINRCKASDDLALLHAESELGQLLARLDILEQLTERTHRGAR
jgi:hypothetical protein